MVKKIGCFITDAWTEAGAMQEFLKKINSDCEYIQCYPHKRRYKKGLNGLTGESLKDEVYRRLELYKDEYKDFSAILIEDDLDCCFA